MWVIYDTDTGSEIDREQDYTDAKRIVRSLNQQAYYGHYAMRWED